MRIIVDEREKDLYQALFSKFQSLPVPSAIYLGKDVLELGDVSIQEDGTEKEWLIIERKTLADLLASIKDGRYEEQSYRLTHATPAEFPLHNVSYVVEGSIAAIRAPHERKMIYGAMASMYFFKGFAVTRTMSVQETADWVFSLADKMDRDFAKGKLPWFVKWTPSQTGMPNNNQTEVSGTNELRISETVVQPPVCAINSSPVCATSSVQEENPVQERHPANPYATVVKRAKAANLTPENMGDIILCQIPHVGPETAMAVMARYKTVAGLVHALQTDPEKWYEGIVTTDSHGKTRKITAACVQNISRFLLGVVTAEVK